MPRQTLRQMRYTRLANVIGTCLDDVAGIAAAVNAAQERLIFAKEAGDQGWYGTWARMAFNVVQSDPYITLPRWGARFLNLSYCKSPVAVQNEFFEFLEFGPGLQPKWDCSGRLNPCNSNREAYSRTDVVSYRDIGTGGKFIRVRAVDPLDSNGTKRVLIQGTDTFDNTIYSQNGASRVTGQYLTITSPFVDTSPVALNTLTGLQKDITNGPIQFFSVDQTTADETLILTMEPSEEVAGYQRYYLGAVPNGCCPITLNSNDEPIVQAEALVKLNFVPVVVDSDYLLIQSSEAIISECQSMRYSMMDESQYKLMAREAHTQAIRYLMGELGHHMGIDSPAISFYPFGSAALEKQAIGTMI